jgi:hypothetical protein
MWLVVRIGFRGSLVRVASRIYVFLIVLSVLVAGSVQGYFAWRDAYARTIGGIIYVQDPSMVYEGGHPSRDYRPGGVDDGCHGAGFEIGTQVMLTELDGSRLATGRIISSFHWEDLDDPGGSVASRAAHGCNFSYQITGAPKRDNYVVVIGSTIYLPKLRQDEFHSTGDGKYFIIPVIRVGFGDGSP